RRPGSRPRRRTGPARYQGCASDALAPRESRRRSRSTTVRASPGEGARHDSSREARSLGARPSPPTGAGRSAAIGPRHPRRRAAARVGASARSSAKIAPRAPRAIPMPPARFGRRSAAGTPHLGTRPRGCTPAGPTSQGVIMWSYTSRVAALALVVATLACSDRPPGPAPEAPPGAPATPSAATRPELLARAFALALAEPAFRAHVKAELDRSPFREHKLP